MEIGSLSDHLRTKERTAGEVERLASLAVDGTNSRPRAGDSSEYLGSRDYQPGMRVRRWDYRSWARLGRPVVREYEEPQRKSIVLIVDTLVPAAYTPDAWAKVLAARDAAKALVGVRVYTLADLDNVKNATSALSDAMA